MPPTFEPGSDEMTVNATIQMPNTLHRSAGFRRFGGVFSIPNALAVIRGRVNAASRTAGTAVASAEPDNTFRPGQFCVTNVSGGVLVSDCRAESLSGSIGVSFARRACVFC